MEFDHDTDEVRSWMHVAANMVTTSCAQDLKLAGQYGLWDGPILLVRLTRHDCEASDGMHKHITGVSWVVCGAQNFRKQKALAQRGEICHRKMRHAKIID